MIRHFSVKLDTISSAHLLSTEDAQIVWEYEELIPNASYFLCFARKGFQLTRESYEATLQEMPELLVLLSKRLSSRGGRNFRVTVGTFLITVENFKDPDGRAPGAPRPSEEGQP